MQLTRRIKYLYTDVVDFTKDRSVEAQIEIVNLFNQMIRDSFTKLNLASSEHVFLPTGDGLGIALLDSELEFDILVQLALTILAYLNDHNESCTNPMLRFQIRVGAEENVDNIITDINGKENVAGSGINSAQRIMALADGNQLLAGQVVFEALRNRQKYLKAFRRFDTRTKHEVPITVYQLIQPGNAGLSVDVPSHFKPPPVKEVRLTEFEAYYLGHAIKNEQLYLATPRASQGDYAILVLNWFLAHDSVEAAHCPSYDAPSIWIYGRGKLKTEEALKYYMSIDFWVCVELEGYFRRELGNIERYITKSSSSTQFFLVSQEGREKLKAEFPQIWEQFAT